MDKREKQISEYVDLIITAFDRVSQDYYKINTTYSADGIVRERVFCYELYYQIRRLQNKKGLTDFNIHGEIDKRGHMLFRKDDRNNPDFVFHVPGSMEKNLIIIEVKGKLDKCGVCKDWATLNKFCDEYQYGKGMWIAYNYSLDEIRQFIVEGGIPIPNDKGKIEIICKKTADSKLERKLLCCLLLSEEDTICQP